jgi:crotonobetainyl-CoA:carnitine CoA-transferase CaiB-like acyl-CoA transferase
MSGPFHGLRVVEFGQYIAAPYCAQLLADGGADVIKVEPLDGDPNRRNGQIIPGESRQYLNKNRGKRSLAVDLDHPEAIAAIRQLVRGADVVLVNFRPGQGKRLGLDYATLSVDNPRLIYAENTAFGTRGPLAGALGMDMMLQAYSGIANLTEHGPYALADPIIDYSAGLLLAWGISTALYHRERTGRGQKLDVALYQAALMMQNNHLTHIDAIDGWRQDFVEEARNALAEGQPWREIMERREAVMPHTVVRAYYGFVPTKDGAIAIAAGGRPIQLRLIKLLGIDDPWVTQPGWLPENATAHAAEIWEQVTARLRQHDSAHWVRVLTEAGVPAAPVRLKDEQFADEQAWANEFFVRLEHDVVGGHTVVAPPVKFSDTPLKAERAAPPLGRDSRAVLWDAGLDDATIDRLVSDGVIRESQMGDV